MNVEHDLKTSEAGGVALRPYSAPKLVRFGTWVNITLGGSPNIQTDGTRSTKSPIG